MLVLDMIEIIPPLGKYKYNTWRILPVKCYIDNSVRLRSCIRNVNSGRCHCRLGSASPFPPPASAPPHPRVLERLPSPSLDRPMEPSDPDASPWGSRGRPCVIHSWGPCPNRVALGLGSSSSSQQGEVEGEEEDEPHRISVVTSLVQVPLTHWMVRISIGPWGQPQGPLTPSTTMPPTSPRLCCRRHYQPKPARWAPVHHGSC
jgi:hypothetical protein